MVATRWFESIKQVLGVQETQSLNADMRSTYRIPCNVPIRLERRKGTMEGRMVNASTQGMKVELPDSIRRGDRVTVHMRGEQPGTQLDVEAEVVWSRRANSGQSYEAGLRIVGLGQHQPSDILTLIRPAQTTLDDRQKRRSQRLPVQWEVRCTVSGRTLRAVTRDISRHGIQIEVGEPVDILAGFNIEIEVEGSRPVRAHGVARRVVQTPGQSIWRVASPLMDMSIEDRKLLEGAIQRHLARS